MSIEFNRVHSPNEVNIVADLAKTIWNEHYVPIIGQDQVDYMIDNFQSAQTISHQIEKDGYEYYLISSDSQPIGYIGINLREEDLFLSKFYLLKESRGLGIGSEALAFIIGRAHELHASAVSLTVNKNNANSINAYLKMGFQNMGPVVTEIGNGYVMDDYVMRISLE